jgi:hypothetical protein
LHGLFTFASCLDVPGRRLWIGADTRDMRQVFHPGFTRDSRYPCCGIYVYGTEGFSAMLHVQADGVYGPVGSLQRCGDLSLVVHIGSERGQPGGNRPEHGGRPLRVSRHCSNIKLMLKQAFHDPAAEEAGPAKYGDQPPRRSRSA